MADPHSDTALPPRLRLDATGWSVWRWIAVRGAGFPATDVLALASAGGAAALDRVLALEELLAAARARALAAVEQELEAHTDAAARRAVAPVLRRLRANAVPAVTPALGASAAAVEALAAAARAVDDARGAAAATLADERRRTSEVLRAAARDPRLREALVWQNRQAVHTGLDALLRQPAGAASSKARQYERLVASYLQRYCTKNDTIGFFGPVAWATVDPAARGVVARPGPALLARRTVYFEYWAIDALAQTIAQESALRPYLAPRRHPAMWVEGTTLHLPIDRTAQLPLEYARLLDACDGERPAYAIAAALLEDPELELAGDTEVYELLEELASRGLATWTLEVPPHLEHPDQRLAELLEAVGDAEVAAPGLAMLAELRAARDQVAAAAGDAEALDRALAALEDTFTQHTSVAAARRAGQTYAGRTIVYEDCQRDLALAIGPAVFERVSAPLGLLLQSARWFTWTLAQRYRATFEAIYRELVAETGAPAIDFLRFWERASDHFSGHDRKAPPLVDETAAEVQRRWASLLGLDGAGMAQRRVDARAADLAPAVAAAFAAPRPGWPSARQHSPDLLIAASSVDAITAGAYTAVLGELHVAVSSLAPWLARQHPHPDELIAEAWRDRPTPVPEPVVAKDRALRADRFSILPWDLDLELGTSRSWRPRAQVVEAGALVVELVDGALRARTRDGARGFALEELLDSFLTNESTSHYRLLAPAQHTPRVTLDGLVLSREAWRFETADLAFAHHDDPLERLLGARRWARQHGLPRFTFYKVPTETKPCYLDLDSPHYVEHFAYLVRKAPHVLVSEMLPALDELWLHDAADRRYTSELRIVLADPEPWRPGDR